MVLADGCPLCGARDCRRELTPYQRKVIELVPYLEGSIWVARFLCRTTGKTFSLLPFWLVPYHQYTASSILFALLLAATAEPDGISSLFAVAEKLLEPDCRVNGFLLGCWLMLCVIGLRRAQPELRRWCEFGGFSSGTNLYGWLAEVSYYCQTLAIRGPPTFDGISGLDEVLNRHAHTTGRFLFGTPSQERGCRAAP